MHAYLTNMGWGIETEHPLEPADSVVVQDSDGYGLWVVGRYTVVAVDGVMVTLLKAPSTAYLHQAFACDPLTLALGA